MKKICYLLATLVVTVLMAACSSSGPKGVVDAYYTELKKGNVEKAFTEYSDSSDKEIQANVKKVEGLNFKISDYEIVSETISDDGESAVVVVKYTYTTSFNDEPKVEEAKTKLKKVDGVWKITQM